jgi:hypothetical protein
MDKQQQTTPCSAELISTAYQPWNSIFLSQQISHSRLISQKTACRTAIEKSNSTQLQTTKHITDESKIVWETNSPIQL